MRKNKSIPQEPIRYEDNKEYGKLGLCPTCQKFWWDKSVKQCKHCGQELKW